MSRVEDTPSWELWGMSEGLYLYSLQTSGQLQAVVAYYETGITMMTAANRDLISSNRYADLSKLELVLIGKRTKTIEFYEKRLKELKPV